MYFELYFKMLNHLTSMKKKLFAGFDATQKPAIARASCICMSTLHVALKIIQSIVAVGTAIDCTWEHCLI